MAASLNVRELAFRSCVNLTAKAVSKCEFKTFEAGEEKRGEVWYSWNIRPNRNQSSSVYLNKLIAKLMEDNEALVIQTDTGEMLVADSYTKEVFAVRDYRFTGVTVDEFTFQRVFYMSDVLFFQLNNKDVRQYVNGLHSSYGQLLEYAQKAFKKSQGQKGILKIASKQSGASDFEDSLRKMMNERFKPYYDADSAVLPLTDGYEYTEQKSRTYSADTTRDIRAQVDDIFVFAARSFGIPPALVLGDLANTSKAVDSLLTFAIDPLTDILSEEINGKTYGKRVLKGNKLVIDTKAIKHIDLLSVATNVDKLISSGAWCINDIRSLVGDEPIDEPWARQHWMTKNYSTVADVMNGLGGDAGK
jgi:HK97 family phage portal protein